MMVSLTIPREEWLRPLQLVNNIMERRQTLPILANTLLSVAADSLTMQATDLEVGVAISIPLNEARAGECTLPARKCLEIVRALPEGAVVELTAESDRAVLRSGRSRFSLTTLPVQDFPRSEQSGDGTVVALAQKDLRSLMERTYFCMAQQDVRYYLNGLLMDVSLGRLRVVATDGHRLAMCDLSVDLTLDEPLQLIVPRKAVLELLRVLENTEARVEIRAGTHQITFSLPHLIFTSKLVDGRFPDYERVVPLGNDKILTAKCSALRNALLRVAILSSDQSRTVRLQLKPGRLTVSAHNLEREEAEEEIEVCYEAGEMEIGFNANYLLDVLGSIGTEEVRLTLLDSASSCLVQTPGDDASRYVVMPMRI
jgi:DNA polymerase-3 subunit beta